MKADPCISYDDAASPYSTIGTPQHQSSSHDQEPYVLTCDDIWDPWKFDPDPPGGETTQERQDNQPETIMRLYDEPPRPVQALNITVANHTSPRQIGTDQPHSQSPSPRQRTRRPTATLHLPQRRDCQEHPGQHNAIGNQRSRGDTQWESQTTHQNPIPVPEATPDKGNGRIRHSIRIHTGIWGPQIGTTFRMYPQLGHESVPDAQRIGRPRRTR